jgi:hypothetical protein
MNLSPKVLMLAGVGVVGALFAFKKLGGKPAAPVPTDTLRTYQDTTAAPAQQSMLPQMLQPAMSYTPLYQPSPFIQPMPSPSTVYSVGQFLQSAAQPSYAPPGAYWVNTTPSMSPATWMLQSYNNPVPMPQAGVQQVANITLPPPHADPRVGDVWANTPLGVSSVQGPRPTAPAGTYWEMQPLSSKSDTGTYILRAGTPVAPPPVGPIYQPSPPFTVPVTGSSVLTSPGYWQVAQQANGAWLATRYAANGGVLRTMTYPSTETQATITPLLQANDTAYAPVNRTGAV